MDMPDANQRLTTNYIYHSLECWTIVNDCLVNKIENHVIL
jgi:hypothetical protein